jgi:hypothetical protein
LDRGELERLIDAENTHYSSFDQRRRDRRDRDDDDDDDGGLFGGRGGFLGGLFND